MGSPRIAAPTALAKDTHRRFADLLREIGLYDARFRPLPDSRFFAKRPLTPLSTPLSVPAHGV